MLNSNEVTQKDLIIIKLLNSEEDTSLNCRRIYKTRRLNSVCNSIYLVEVEKDNNTVVFNQKSKQADELSFFQNPNEFKFVLKIFGDLSFNVDRDAENRLINHLSKNNMVAKMLISDSYYRVEEFLEGYEETTQDELNIYIENMIDIISEIGLLEVHKFKKDGVIDTENNLDLIFKKENNKYINYRILEEEESNHVVNDIYSTSPNFIISKKKKLLDFLDITIFPSYFSEHEKLKNLISFDLKNRDGLIFIENHLIQRIKELKIIRNYFERIEEMIDSTIPLSGIFVMTHNDLHKGNVMIKSNLRSRETENDFIKVMDMEFAKLNLFGYDFANHLAESCFDLGATPFGFRSFDKELNLRNYQIFADRCIKKINNIKGNNYIDDGMACFLKSEEYFTNLCIISSLYWIINFFTLEECMELNDENLKSLLEKASTRKIENRLECAKEENLFVRNGFDRVHYTLKKFEIIDSLF